MKDLILILKRFAPPYKGYIVCNFFCNLLATIFSLFSFATIIPILQIMDSTMLNVAVSRARDAFWYVGNMNGMTGKGLRPSSILAQFLVKGKYQRLAQWSLPFDTPHDLKMSTVMSSDPQQRVALLT